MHVLLTGLGMYGWVILRMAMVQAIHDADKRFTTKPVDSLSISYNLNYKA